MQDDAKLGLVAGVAAVIFGAVVYLPEPQPPAAPASQVTAPRESGVTTPVALGPPVAPSYYRTPGEAPGMTTSLARVAP